MANDCLTFGYNSKSRFLSYWYQLYHTIEVSPESVLVVGRGSGVTEALIRALTNGRVSSVSLDIDPEKKPDVVGSVTAIPLEGDSFDVVLCCQVLEHIPFGEFEPALREMHRVSRGRVVLSLPHGRQYFRMSLKLPRLRDMTIILKNPFTKRNWTTGRHLWEISRGVSLAEVRAAIEKAGFRIEKTFLNEMNCKHRFFILDKR